MYTKNSYYLLNMSMGFGNAQSSAEALYFKKIDGTNQQGLKFASDSSGITMLPVVIRVGSGNTPATIDDYTLENMFDTPSEIVYYTHVYFKEIVGNKIINTITVVITNVSSGNIVINEVGLFNSTVANNANLDAKSALMIRDIIPPITLVQNERTRMTYKTEILIGG